MGRWIGRIGLALAALVALAVVVVVVGVHTHAGRERIRRAIEAELASTFTGGAQIGRLDGTPFGTVVLHDIVIEGPDRTPAIRIATLRLRVSLVALLAKRVRVEELVAEGVDADLSKERVAHLLAPRPAEPLAWTVDLPRIAVRRARVAFDTGEPALGTVTLDRLAIDATAHLRGDRRVATVELHGQWRERDVPVAATAVLRDDAQVTALPAFDLRAGAVAITLHDVSRMRAVVRGWGTIVAPRAGVAALVHGVDLRDDLALALAVVPEGVASRVTAAGTYGATPVEASLRVAASDRHVAGRIAVGELALGPITRGAVAGRVAGTIDLDVRPGAAGELPTARATVRGHGTVLDLPRAELALRLDTHGQHAAATATVTGPIAATLAAEVVRDRDVLRLDHATLVASTRDAARASGGKLPVRGALDVDLAARGVLAPAPALAITGTVAGRQLHVRDAGIGSLELSIDATQLPARPHGHASLRARDLARGDTHLDTLALDASDRPDGRIDVTARAEERDALVELAALVTPPGRGGTTVVELARHRVRIDRGREWTGSSGRLVVAPDTIELRDLRSSSGGGTVTADATYRRASGDLSAAIAASRIALASVGDSYAGTATGGARVTRRRGRWSVAATADATGVAFEQGAAPLDVHAALDGRPGEIRLDASASAAQLGRAELALELAAPADLTNAAAWRARGPRTIRAGRIALRHVDLARVASLAHVDGRIEGHVDADLDLAAGVATGTVAVRRLIAPGLERAGPIDADLRLAQAAPGELAPELDVTLDGIGRATATARLALPAHLFDPAAWRALGPSAVREATVHARDLVIDPATSARVGATSDLRGRASLDLEVAPGMRAIHATLDATDLRGTSLARPVDLHADARFDDGVLAGTVALHGAGSSTSLAELHARIPIALDRLRFDAHSLHALPVTATVELVRTPAPDLLALLGHTEITGGTLRGTAAIAGTLGRPMVIAHLVGDELVVPPGPHGTPVKIVKRLAIDGTWNERGGSLAVDAAEAGGGRLVVEARFAAAALAQGTATITATRFDLGPVVAFAPGPVGGAAGVLDAKLAIHGLDPRTAQLAGELHLRDARVPIAPEVGTLRDARIDLDVRAHEIVAKAAGKLGAGTVTLDGAIALDGASLTGGRAKIALRKVSPIGEIEPQIDADVTARLERRNTRWTADLVVDHGKVAVTDRKGEKLKPVDAPSDLRLGGPTEPTRAARPSAPPAQPIIVANITIHPTQVESKEVRTVISGKLAITADADHVGIVGTITGERGELDLFDRRYQIEQAEISFDGSTDPRLAIRFVYDFPTVTTTTEVRGRLSNPRLVMSSSPAGYTQSQLLGFLLGGEPGGDPTSSSARNKAESVGTSLVANQISGYIKRALPFDIDVLRYEAATSTTSAAITVGTWITRSLFLAFKNRPSPRPDENSSEGTIVYWLTHRFQVEATIGDRGYNGIDLLWRKRY